MTLFELVSICHFLLYQIGCKFGFQTHMCVILLKWNKPYDILKLYFLAETHALVCSYTPNFVPIFRFQCNFSTATLKMLVAFNFLKSISNINCWNSKSLFQAVIVFSQMRYSHYPFPQKFPSKSSGMIFSSKHWK